MEDDEPDVDDYDLWEESHEDEYEAMAAIEEQDSQEEALRSHEPLGGPDFFALRNLRAEDDSQMPFSSSPPTFTSPTSRMEQPCPMPSDFEIHSKRVHITESDAQPLTAHSFGESPKERSQSIPRTAGIGGLIGSASGSRPVRKPFVFSDSEDEVEDEPMVLSRTGETKARTGGPGALFDSEEPASQEFISEGLLSRGLEDLDASLSGRSLRAPPLEDDDIYGASPQKPKRRTVDPIDSDLPVRPNKRISMGLQQPGSPDAEDRVFAELQDVDFRQPRRSILDEDNEALMYPDSDNEEDVPMVRNRFAKPPIETLVSTQTRFGQSSTPAGSLTQVLRPTSTIASKPPPPPKKRNGTIHTMPIRNYTLLPSSNSFRIARASSGGTLYLPRRNPPRSVNTDVHSNVEIAKARPALLGTSIHKLMETLEQEQIRSAEDESARQFIIDECRRTGKSLPEPNIDSIEPLVRPRTDGGNKGPKEKLWVDKYSPRMYIDLVGDERINRDVLGWVKEWDFCVFRKPKRNQGPATSRSERAMGFARDPFQRPDKKILLLTGPPGLGKTTLAHVIARHAGYSVAEINASDDRTGDAIKTRLIGALETQSVLGSKRPNLVVIDEIDGASSSGQGDQNFIKLLLEFVIGDSRPSKGSGGPATEKRTTGKKATKRHTLVRPIICICNDPYAPVLRPLRHLAHVVNFKAPPTKVLAKRLHEICRWEGLHADLRTLTALCELTDGDIRSSLNTLQFLRKRTTVLTMAMLEQLDVGQKDIGRGLFVVWQELFMLSISRGKRKVNVVKDWAGGEDDSSRYVHRLQSLISSNGEYDKIIQGCHENFLRTKIFDTSYSNAGSDQASAPRSKIEQAFEWLNFYDTLSHRVHVKQQYEVAGYMAYPAITFHRLFSGVTRVRLEYPRADAELHTGKLASRNVLTSLIGGMPPVTRRTWTDPETAMVHLVSPLTSILSPEIRVVNLRLAKAAEAETIARLVDIMATLGIRFAQEKNEDGTYNYHLDPPIDLLTRAVTANASTEGLVSIVTFSTRRVLGGPYAVKQMIAQEIDREILRRAEAATVDRNNPGGVPEEVVVKQKRSITAGKHKKPPKPNIVREYVPTVIEPEKAPRDFFGRLIVAAPIVKAAEAVGDDGLVVPTEPAGPAQARVAFKFNEGFSNAVRKVVYVHNFM